MATEKHIRPEVIRQVARLDLRAKFIVEGFLAGLHAISMSRFENGTRKPTWETVPALSDALGVECTAFCKEPTSPVEKRSRGRPPKQEVTGAVPAAPAAPPAEDLEGQAEAGPAATKGPKPKRARARRPKGK